MTTYTGQSGKVKSGANDVGEVRGFSVNITAETVDNTVMGDTWRTKVATQQMWTASIDVLYDDDDTNGQNAFAIGSTVSLGLHPYGDSTGDAKLTGSGIVTARNITSQYEGNVEMTLEIEGDGALTEGQET